MIDGDNLLAPKIDLETIALVAPLFALFGLFSTYYIHDLTFLDSINLILFLHPYRGREKKISVTKAITFLRSILWRSLRLAGTNVVSDEFSMQVP